MQIRVWLGSQKQIWVRAGLYLQIKVWAGHGLIVWWAGLRGYDANQSVDSIVYADQGMDGALNVGDGVGCG